LDADYFEHGEIGLRTFVDRWERSQTGGDRTAYIV